MAKNIKYSGQFVGLDAVWKVEIWTTAAAGSVSDLTFEVDALQIEWEEKSKEEVLQGSTCTIRIESPGDRTYIGLYTIKPGEIGVNIYRDDVLYWTGCLDPEFYEEPYERLKNYPVELTFTDFGILDRLKYNATGLRTLRSIVDEALERSNIDTLTLDQTLVSLGDGESPLKLENIQIRSDNFYDEDGNPSTMAEVIEGILQPLALRMVQRGGKIWIYDLNGLYSSGISKEIEWSGDSQTLGVDEVKNNVEITWSPYPQADKLTPEEIWNEKKHPIDRSLINLDNFNPVTKNGAKVWSYHLTPDLNERYKPGTWEQAVAGNDVENFMDEDQGFSLWIREADDADAITPVDFGLVSKQKTPAVFKIVPHFDGQESEGVALCWPAAKQGEKVFATINLGYHNGKNIYTYIKKDVTEVEQQGVSSQSIVGPWKTACSPIFTTKPVTISPMDDGAVQLRISLDLLIDPRINPFEEAVNIDGCLMKDHEDDWNLGGHFVYMPVNIYYRPNGTLSTVYVWCSSQPGSPGAPATSLRGSLFGSWRPLTGDGRPGTPPQGKVNSYLAYWDPDNHTTKSGVLGWQTNHQCIAPSSEKLDPPLMKGGTGQIIPYPPKAIQGATGGELWMEVSASGWIAKRYADASLITTTTSQYYHSVWRNDHVNWLLMKLPKIEMVSSNVASRELSDDDIVYEADINPDADEGISLDTICGTIATAAPTARGAYYGTDGGFIRSFSRAGRNGTAEELLIGTLFSQFAERHTKLTGEADITLGGLSVFTEANQEGKKFMLLGEVQNLREGVSECTFVELSPDEYDKKL